MNGLRASQKAKFGSIITEYELQPRDFGWRQDPKPTLKSSTNPQEIFHHDTDHYFRFEEREGTKIFITYTPDENTSKPVNLIVETWAQVLGYFDKWIGIIKEEAAAVDPWADPEDSDTFSDEDTQFTPLELKSVDNAIDKSMEKLLQVANENGIHKTLADIQDDIKYLKESARKNSRSEWLDLFKQVIAGKLLEWGLGAALASGILQVLFETAKPVLKLLATQ